MPVYLDHNATTPLDPRVLEAMLPFLGNEFGNPSSVHRWGREARTALDEAHERVARCIGASADEVIFTSCGTEADNMAVLGVWRARREGGRTAVLTTPIEHKAVLAAAHQVIREGGDERLGRHRTTEGHARSGQVGSGPGTHGNPGEPVSNGSSAETVGAGKGR